MKSFKKHLAEATTNLNICDLLAGDDIEFIKHYNALNSPGSDNKLPSTKLNTNAKQFIKALSQWYYQSAGKKNLFLPILQEAAKCSNRAAWTYYTGGKVYRGVFKSLESVNLILENKMLDDPVQLGFDGGFLVGTATYNSIYPMQSWTSRGDSSYEFANTDYRKKSTTLKGRKQKYPMIFEAVLPKEQTFLNDDISNYIGRFGEHEVIRIGNTPLKCKVYIFYDSFEKMLWNGLVGTKEAKDLADAMRQEFNNKDPKKTKNNISKKVLKTILSKTLGLGDKGAEFLVEKTKFYKNIIRRMTYVYPFLTEYPV